jgi:hypothetical protein
MYFPATREERTIEVTIAKDDHVMQFDFTVKTNIYDVIGIANAFELEMFDSFTSVDYDIENEESPFDHIDHPQALAAHIVGIRWKPKSITREEFVKFVHTLKDGDNVGDKFINMYGIYDVDLCNTAKFDECISLIVKRYVNGVL